MWSKDLFGVNLLQKQGKTYIYDRDMNQLDDIDDLAEEGLLGVPQPSETIPCAPSMVKITIPVKIIDTTLKLPK